MFNDFYEYEVYSIKFDGAITVDYKYSPLNGKERRQKAKLRKGRTMIGLKRGTT